MKRAIVSIVAIAAAALAPAAHAGARADYKQMFSTPVPGASTGTDTQILYKNQSDPNAKPIPVRREVFTFPEGTTYDGSVVPNCTASDLMLQLMGTAACPPESWVGGGQGDTSMTGFPGPDTDLDVDAYDNDEDSILLGGPHGYPVRWVTHARRNGTVITVEVPSTPGGPPDGESALRYVHNVFPARSVGDRAYTRTPPTCPSSGVWTFKGEFTFADGVIENDVYEMPCEQAPPATP
jgi:hypothetical protein